MSEEGRNEPGREMPEYVCHKRVRALRIMSIDLDEDNAMTGGGAIIVPYEEGYAPFRVDGDYMHRHEPKVGGYYVVYEGGYKSFSPAKPFEGGYTLVK